MRAHLELGGTREVLVSDGSAGRVEDEIDEVVFLPRLVEPVLGRLLDAESRLHEHVERTVGVLFAQEEVDVVIRRRAAARPDREAAAEHVVDARFAQRRAGSLHRRQQRVEVLWRSRRHDAAGYPGSVFAETPASGIHAPVNATIRIAAAGDVHAAEPLRERLARAFARSRKTPISFCSPAISRPTAFPSRPRSWRTRAPALRFRSSRCSETTTTTRDARTRSRTHFEPEASSCSTAGTSSSSSASIEVGIVGTKGFVGGFAGAEIPDFGEPALRQIYHETTLEVEALEQGLEAVSGCHKRIVLLHYAPITETIVGEPEAIWAFLGSGRLAGPIGMHRPELVVHGHAHHGAAHAAQSAPFRCTTSPCTSPASTSRPS